MKPIVTDGYTGFNGAEHINKKLRGSIIFTSSFRLQLIKVNPQRNRFTLIR